MRVRTVWYALEELNKDFFLWLEHDPGSGRMKVKM